MILGQDIWALDSGSQPWRCKGFSHITKKNTHENWWQVPTNGVSFNMLDAASTCVWAVDYEYQAYLFVKECDIPIRFQDYKYLYERWYLARGWKAVVRDEASPKRQLSHHWTSDSVWRVDRNIDGATTDKEGWQYASGFTSTFSPVTSTINGVRRKRLAKYYTYNKMGRWAKLDSGEIKFLDVAVGGTMLPDSDNWPICVWGVSKECRVYFRSNISSINPEGDQWEEVCQPDFQLAKLSVGPRGQLWGITTQGELITRTGITVDNLCGSEWLEISISVGSLFDIFPTSLSVSADSVWMIDCKGRVFFHKGADVFVRNTLLLTDKHDTKSQSKWLHMIMKPEDQISFCSLSCGPENQVWGLDNDNRIFNRTDITPTQISGQNWQPIEDPKLKNTSGAPPPDSDDEAIDPLASLSRRMPTRSDSTAISLSSTLTLPINTPTEFHTLDNNSLEGTMVGSQGSLRAHVQLAESQGIFLEPGDIYQDSESEGWRGGDPLETAETRGPCSSGVHYWKLLSAGGCQGVGVRRDEVTQKQAELSKVQIAAIKHCRAAILHKLRDQSTRIRSTLFDNYQDVVDDGGFKLKSNAKILMGSVLKNATVFLSKNIPHGNLRFRIYLPGVANFDSEEDKKRIGTRAKMRHFEAATVINPTSTVEHIEQVRLVSLLGIKRISPNVKLHTLLLYTTNRSYMLTFERDTDCNNWFDRVNDYVRAVHEVPNVPPYQSVWVLTGDGTPYFSPPVPTCVTNHSKRPWLPLEGNFLQIAAGPCSIVWGVAPDNSLYHFTRGYGGGSHHMGENLENFTVQRHFKVRENQRYKWFSGFQPCGARDRKSRWEDSHGNPLESQNQYRLPLSSWRWIGEWTVQLSEDCGVDGWHYAKNFHSPFSGSPGVGARKRYLLRLAQMNCTSPWKKIPVSLVKIARVSLEQYCYKTSEELVVGWALCTNGSLLYRHGITAINPAGLEWEHVDIDHPLVDISLDAFCNLWAVCKDGSAYFRVGISEETPLGQRWMHIVKPEGDHLTRIAAGKYGVWAIGSSGSCYLRTRISSIREYGSSWEPVNCEPMRSVSVSGSDQVFGVRTSDNTVVSRAGVSGDKLMGTKWSAVLQDVWADVCVTATTQQHHWDQIDELLSGAMATYREGIWQALRESRLRGSWLDYHVHCPPIHPGDRVCVRSQDGAWSRNIIDHISSGGRLNIRHPGIFSCSYEGLSACDVIRDEPPHPSHVAAGSKVLARLNYMSNKLSPCTVKSIDKGKGVLTIEESTAQLSFNTIRLPNVVLSHDLYFLDGQRRHSITNDEFGKALNII